MLQGVQGLICFWLVVTAWSCFSAVFALKIICHFANKTFSRREHWITIWAAAGFALFLTIMYAFRGM